MKNHKKVFFGVVFERYSLESKSGSGILEKVEVLPVFPICNG